MSMSALELRSRRAFVQCNPVPNVTCEARQVPVRSPAKASLRRVPGRRYQIRPPSLPDPASIKVLINVAGSGINPSDWKILSGAMKQCIVLPLPYTPGVEVAGTVWALDWGSFSCLASRTKRYRPELSL